VTTQLAQRLNKTVVNLGRTSYGPQQELEVLRRYGLALHPQVCVWAFYEGNDLQDLDQYDAQRRSVCRLASRPDALLYYDRSLTRNSLEFAIRTWLRPEPMLAAVLYSGQFIDRSGRSREFYFATGVQHGEGDPQLPREQCRQLQRFRSVLSQAHELCARNGIDLVVVFLPAKFRVYRPYCQFAPDSPCRNWPVDELAGAVEKMVHDVGPEIVFLNLAPSFQAAAASGELLYLPDDTHWSADGHHLAARGIARSLTQRHQTALRSKPEPVEKQGSRR
jgi:acetyltransferase AlgX (SGNH hydrolase-like protein)